MKKSSSLFFSSNKKLPSTSSLKRTLDIANGGFVEGKDNVSFSYVQHKVVFFYPPLVINLCVYYSLLYYLKIIKKFIAIPLSGFFGIFSGIFWNQKRNK